MEPGSPSNVFVRDVVPSVPSRRSSSALRSDSARELWSPDKSSTFSIFYLEQTRTTGISFKDRSIFCLPRLTALCHGHPLGRRNGLVGIQHTRIAGHGTPKRGELAPKPAGLLRPSRLVPCSVCSLTRRGRSYQPTSRRCLAGKRNEIRSHARRPSAHLGSTKAESYPRALELHLSHFCEIDYSEAPWQMQVTRASLQVPSSPQDSRVKPVEVPLSRGRECPSTSRFPDVSLGSHAARGQKGASREKAPPGTSLPQERLPRPPVLARTFMSVLEPSHMTAHRDGCRYNRGYPWS